jgi:hypothetical protein
VQTGPVGPFELIKELNAQQTSQDVGEQRKGMGTAFAEAEKLKFYRTMGPIADFSKVFV